MRNGMTTCILLATITVTGAASAQQRADANCDGVVNNFDIDPFLVALQGQTAYYAQYPGCHWLCTSDLNSDGTVNNFDIDSFVDCLNAGPGGCGLCSDGDGDRIPDLYETGTGIFVSRSNTGSSPTVADSDGDGLADGDEVLGTLGGLDLPGFGATPVHKDIFIECDWVHATGVTADRNRPHANQTARVITAFQNAPRTNLDGVNGIRMHIDRGQAPFNGGNAVEDPSGNDTVNTANSSIDDEFNTIKGANFAANRNGYFYYAIFCDKYSIGDTYQNSSGLAELTGDDLIVSMGQWATGDSNHIGNTLMHELGHNLGLRHGGDEDRNFKPNYNSVMSYRYQFCGVDSNNDSLPDGGLDYSRSVLADLDEDSLNEALGVNGTTGIDWNNDGDATDANVSRNINCRPTNTFANSTCGTHARQDNNCGTQGVCFDATCNVLSGFDDWVSIVFTGLGEADAHWPQVVSCVLDETEDSANVHTGYMSPPQR